jgi:hypothetical protein
VDRVRAGSNISSGLKFASLALAIFALTFLLAVYYIG